MKAKVHPSGGAAPATKLRGEAYLGSKGGASGEFLGSQRFVVQQNRSEFDILLDFLDTDGNGKISALELANFIDSLLGTQEHKEPQGSIVFKAVLQSAMRHSSERATFNPPGREAAAMAGSCGPSSESQPPAPGAQEQTLRVWTHAGGDGSSATGASVDRGQDLERSPVAPGPMGAAGRAGSLAAPGAGGGGGKAVATGPPLTEEEHYASMCFLGMEDVRDCFNSLMDDKALWLNLAAGHSIMTTTLLGQLLLYAGGRLEKRFSLGVFARTYAAFNALPFWLPFPSLWRDKGPGVLQAVYLHQLSKLHQQLGPRLAARLPMHGTLVVLTMLQFIATYVPLIAFWAAHGVPALWRTHSVVEFVQDSPLSTELSLFVSVLPWAVLQFLTSSGALKLSCRDFVNLKEQCKAVFLLGDVHSEFEGYPGLTLRAVMDTIKGGVEEAMQRSPFRRLNAAMPLIFSLGLELFRRLVRVFLVRNWVAEEPLAKAVLPFELYAMFYNIWFAYSEPANCVEYCLRLKKVSGTFKALLTKEEALPQGLPWLNNHSPRNLLLWSRLRRYYQSPNCLELRWIEMHLTLVVLAAVAVTCILVVTFVQKTLVKFTPENADLQLFVAWVIPCFIYLVMGFVIDVIMSASTGAQYHDGVMTLTAESIAIADRLESAEELERADAEEREQHAAATAPASGGVMLATSGLVRRAVAGGAGGRAGPAAAAPGADWNADGAAADGGYHGNSGGDGGGEWRWRPAEQYRLGPMERARLRQCQDVIRSLVSYIQFNAEYITLFGVPIDTQLRNTLFSVAVTLVGAGVSAFLAIVVKR